MKILSIMKFWNKSPEKKGFVKAYTGINKMGKEFFGYQKTIQVGDQFTPTVTLSLTPNGSKVYKEISPGGTSYTCIQKKNSEEVWANNLLKKVIVIKSKNNKIISNNYVERWSLGGEKTHNLAFNNDQIGSYTSGIPEFVKKLFKTF